MNAMSNNPWLDIASYQTSDAYRFKGRDEDILKFYNIIENRHLSVLYAESGIGKTSFLNAGIIPILKDYAPIHIVFPDDVFTNTELDIRQWIFDTIENEVKEAGLQWKLNLQDQESDLKDLDTFLWWRLHACELTDEAGTVKKPMLIFDQFEEVFIKSNRDGNENLLTALFSNIQQLSSHNVPNKVLDVLNKLYEEKQIHVNYNRNSEYKIIFSLRKEYLSDFDYWTNDRYSVTELFQNRMYLRPFSREQARQVICEQEGVSALNDVAGKIIESIDPNNHSEVEPFVLSVLCSRLFSEAQRRGKDKLAASDFDEINVNNIIRDFYEDTISTIVTKRSHVAALETLLVDEDCVRTRIRVNQAELQKLGFEKSYKQKLDDSHLIRIIKINDNDYVELIHDRIAKAIYEKRNERQKKNRRIGLRLLLVALYLFVLWFTYHNVMESENKQFCRNHTYTKFVDRTKSICTTDTTAIDLDAYYNYDGLIEIENKDYLEEIVVEQGLSAYETKVTICSCRNLDRIIVREGVVMVDLRISDCPKLSNITIPKSVKEISIFIERCPCLFNFFIPNKEVIIRSCDISSEVLQINVSNPRYKWYSNALWDIEVGSVLFRQSDADFYSDLNFDAPDEITKDTLLIIRNGSLSNIGHLYVTAFRHIGSLSFSEDLTTLDLRGLQIDSIPDWAFLEMFHLKKVYLPHTITHIGVGAFAYCYNLEWVNFEDCPNLRFIGGLSFYNCRKLDSVILSNSDTSLLLCPVSFSGSGVSTVKFPKRMKGIYVGAFSRCDSMISVAFPDTVDFVDKEAFCHCNQLSKVILPKRVRTFKETFESCFNLKEIDFNGNMSFEYDQDSILWFNGNCLNLHNQVINSQIYPFLLADGSIYIDNRKIFDSVLTITVSSLDDYPVNDESFVFVVPPSNIKKIVFKSSNREIIQKVVQAIPDSLRKVISISLPYNCFDYCVNNSNMSGLKGVSEDGYLEAWTFLFSDLLRRSVGRFFGSEKYYWQKIFGFLALAALVGFLTFRVMKRTRPEKIMKESVSSIQCVIMLPIFIIMGYIIYWFIYTSIGSLKHFDWNNMWALHVFSYFIAMVVSAFSVSFLLYPRESNQKMINKIVGGFRGIKRRITR